MKRMMTIVLSMLLVLSGFGFVYADDGGLNRHSREVESMQQSMIHGDQFSDSLKSMVDQTVVMMQGVSEKLENSDDRSSRKELTKVMKGLSAHIKDISKMMSKGKASTKDITRLQNKLAETGSRLGMIN